MQNSAKLPLGRAHISTEAERQYREAGEPVGPGIWHEGFKRGFAYALSLRDAEQSEDAAPPSESERELLAKRLWKEATASGEGFCPPSWSGHWMDWYRLRADEIIARRNAEQANGASQALAAIDKCFGPRCAGETHAKHDEHILQEIEAILRAHYGGGK